MSSTAPSGRLDRLTSMRFVAAFVVFGFHGLVFFDGTTSAILANFFGQGRSGVSFFFVLSGFVLAWSARDRDRPRDFFIRRFARIYPTYLVALALAAMSLAFVGYVVAVPQALPTLLLLQAWIPDSDYYFAWNTPAWSLSVEAFFYLLFPVVYVIISRLRNRSLLVTACVCGSVVIGLAALSTRFIAANQLDANTTANWFFFYFPPVRLPEFVIGICLAVMFKRDLLPRIPVIPASLTALVAYLACGVWPSSFGVTGACLIPIAGLIVASAQRDMAGSPGLAASRPAVYAGATSFCFYLVHHIFVIRLAQPGWVAIGIDHWVGFLLALILSSGAAVVLHHMVELRGNRLILRLATEFRTRT